MTPSSTHPMSNQDIVLGAAVARGGKQYYKVVDMFTPSRAKPLPDANFCVAGGCGTDDIDDATGAPVTLLSVLLDTFLRHQLRRQCHRCVLVMFLAASKVWCAALAD